MKRVLPRHRETNSYAPAVFGREREKWTILRVLRVERAGIPIPFRRDGRKSAARCGQVGICRGQFTGQARDTSLRTGGAVGKSGDLPLSIGQKIIGGTKVVLRDGELPGKVCISGVGGGKFFFNRHRPLGRVNSR